MRLWDIAQKKEVRQYLGHTGSANRVAVSPDGRHVLSGGDDRTVRVWDLESGRELYRFVDQVGGVLAVAWSPTGRHILFGGERGLRLWRVPDELVKPQPVTSPRR